MLYRLEFDGSCYYTDAEEPVARSQGHFELDFKRHVDERIFIGFILFNVAFERTLGEFLHRVTTRSAGFEAGRTTKKRSEKRSRFESRRIIEMHGRASKTVLRVARTCARKNIDVVARSMMYSRHDMRDNVGIAE